MIRSSRPAVDLRLGSAFGHTRDGQPLAYNRAPAPDLAGWIARIYAVRLGIPAGETISCGLFADTGCIRIQLSGDWAVETRDGEEAFGRGALFFGPQSRLRSLKVSGEAVTIGVALRPSACVPLLKSRLRDMVDRAASAEAIGLSPDLLLSRLRPDGSPEEWLSAVEAVFRQLVAATPLRPDPITTRFEERALADPTVSVTLAARELGVDRRRLERLVNRDFGMPPKQVLKRARALDMAAHLRGVADENEAEALALRYYDESHLIHEFIELFGMPPRQFSATPQPMFTLLLEARQTRRLEMMNRLRPGERRPWQ